MAKYVVAHFMEIVMHLCLKILRLIRMKIQILGTGCSKCVKTHEIVKKAVAQLGIDATIEKVEDVMEIMKYNAISTPAVAVNGEVKIKGRIPSEQEIVDLLK
ncbi:thioredoxin family protein [Dichelobacter nodosus]|uniref:Redox-active disulfide protein family n=2 Tax=Dichelobacter nodosus TaxID=870 RepID=A5EVW6_DICNV|nr:thioredoxin family protein [Dichelobacter nodosus]ABQ13335.1 redox-active disulfide protein family [Dichelobacter nodosus VCS1703A]